MHSDDVTPKLPNTKVMSRVKVSHKTFVLTKVFLSVVIWTDFYDEIAYVTYQ